VAQPPVGPRPGTSGPTGAISTRPWEKAVWIQGPNARYAVARDMIRAVNTTLRQPSDSAAVALYAAIEDSIGRKLSDLRCDPLHAGPWGRAEENAVADWVALRMLAAAGVEPASYPTIARIADPSYHRPLDWGQRRCIEPRDRRVLEPTSG